MTSKMRPCIQDGERRKDPARVRKPKDLSGEFEAPMWAHGLMRKMGLNPQSLDDWSLFEEHCE